MSISTLFGADRAPAHPGYTLSLIETIDYEAKAQILRDEGSTENYRIKGRMVGQVEDFDPLLYTPPEPYSFVGLANPAGFIGCIAYGDLIDWEEGYTMIEAVGDRYGVAIPVEPSQIPYMIKIGNHAYPIVTEIMGVVSLDKDEHPFMAWYDIKRVSPIPKPGFR